MLAIGVNGQRIRMHSHLSPREFWLPAWKLAIFELSIPSPDIILQSRENLVTSASNAVVKRIRASRPIERGWMNPERHIYMQGADLTGILHRLQSTVIAAQGQGASPIKAQSTSIRSTDSSFGSIPSTLVGLHALLLRLRFSCPSQTPKEGVVSRRRRPPSSSFVLVRPRRFHRSWSEGHVPRASGEIRRSVVRKGYRPKKPFRSMTWSAPRLITRRWRSLWVTSLSRATFKIPRNHLEQPKEEQVRQMMTGGRLRLFEAFNRSIDLFPKSVANSRLPLTPFSSTCVSSPADPRPSFPGYLIIPNVLAHQVPSVQALAPPLLNTLRLWIRIMGSVLVSNDLSLGLLLMLLFGADACSLVLPHSPVSVELMSCLTVSVYDSATRVLPAFAGTEKLPFAVL